MDALSDVLRVMRLKGGVFLKGEFHDPWCLSSKADPETCGPYLGEASHIIPYHFVLDGRMRVRVADNEELEIGPGESVLFPHNDQHLIGSDLSRPPVPSEDVVQQSADGGLWTISLAGSGATTQIICGFLAAEEVRGNPVIDSLPSVLSLDANASLSADWVWSTFRFAAERIAEGRAGSEVIMSKLSELLFVEAVQRYVPAGNRNHLGLAYGRLSENHDSQQGLVIEPTALGRVADQARNVELPVTAAISVSQKEKMGRVG